MAKKNSVHSLITNFLKERNLLLGFYYKTYMRLCCNIKERGLKHNLSLTWGFQTFLVSYGSFSWFWAVQSKWGGHKICGLCTLYLHSVNLAPKWACSSPSETYLATSSPVRWHSLRCSGWHGLHSRPSLAEWAHMRGVIELPLAGSE